MVLWLDVFLYLLSRVTVIVAREWKIIIAFCFAHIRYFFSGIWLETHLNVLAYVGYWMTCLIMVLVLNFLYWHNVMCIHVFYHFTIKTVSSVINAGWLNNKSSKKAKNIGLCVCVTCADLQNLSFVKVRKFFGKHALNSAYLWYQLYFQLAHYIYSQKYSKYLLLIGQILGCTWTIPYKMFPCHLFEQFKYTMSEV